MTHKRLLEELGQGELAFQIAHDELDDAKRTREEVAKAQAIAAQLRRAGGR